jgi:hypothetical protein
MIPYIPANDTGETSGIFESRIDASGVNTKELTVNGLGLVVNAVLRVRVAMVWGELVDIPNLNFGRAWI